MITKNGTVNRGSIFVRGIPSYKLLTPNESILFRRTKRL